MISTVEENINNQNTISVDQKNPDQEIEINLTEGTLKNLKTKEEFKMMPLPDFLMEILKAGGAIEAIKKRLKKEGA